jgi:hypothetical protein
MGFDFPENYIDNPEAILKKTRAKLMKVSVENSEVRQAKRNLAPKFEAMANKTLHEFSALTTENICTGPQVNIGEDGFELKHVLLPWGKQVSFVERLIRCKCTFTTLSQDLQHLHDQGSN